MEGIKQQILKLVGRNNRILVATPENPCVDALGSAFALTNAFKKLNKKAEILIPEKLPEKFHFLNKHSSLNPLSLQTFKEREFVLTLKNPQNHINNLYYQKQNDLLHIYLTGKNEIQENDLRIKRAHPFDLIFMIKIPDYEKTGKVFEYNRELFIETPVINIDNHVNNEEFGEINLVDVNSSSVSEITLDLIDFMDRNLLDKQIATQILAGLIDATNNFQSSKTNPRTFNNAAVLINRGGDQQEIIRYFYKTKSLNFLKLWGKVLHNLSEDKGNKVVWGKIQTKDFQQTNTAPEHTPQVLEEIKTHFPNMQTCFLIWPEKNTIRGIIHSSDSDLLENIRLKMREKLNGENEVKFQTNNQDLETTEKQIINLITGRK